MTNPVLWVEAFSAFLFGACVGSFLNVCIYRWPRDLAVHKPSRSFCPGCKKPIPIHRNIPLLSWLLLRGRCADCNTRIPFRYLFVEALTAGVFLWLWLAYPPLDAVALAAFAVACIVTVFVDFEFFIIPDQVTYGFVPVGLVAATVVPKLVGADTWQSGLMGSAIGAVTGWIVLRAIVEGGKLAFGRKRRQFKAPVPFKIHEKEGNAVLELDGETITWNDLFGRETDQLRIFLDRFEVDGQPAEGEVLALWWSRAAWSDRGEVPLTEFDCLEGTTACVVIPREAMGMGDVKFMAMVGAFLGWQGVLFALFAASLYGSAFGLSMMAIRRNDWAGRIPFGPWLVAGAWTWILVGPPLVAWYLGLAGF